MKESLISPDKIHPLAIEVCRILQGANYQSFIVGGCVRDLLLRQNPKDWDITTNAQPEDVIRLFSKTIPTGLQHGTVTVCMGEGVENHFEVTTFRVEGKYLDGRRPESVSFVQDVKEDLARRDLTINAMAYNPLTGELVDPYGGQQDLQKGFIQAVGNPEARFQEDGLRIMRVARFAARFGYHIGLSTLEGMKSSLDTLKKVSKERISDELSKTLMAQYPSLGLHILQESGALDVVCPSLSGRQLPLLSKQNKCYGDLETRLAFLYNRLPVKLVEQELNLLKFSNKEIKRVIFLLNALEKYAVISDNAAWDIPGYVNLIAYLKNEAPDPYEYALEQFIALTEPGGSAKSMLHTYETRMPTVVARREMLLNGDDLLAMGMKPGPQIKKILERCYVEVLSHPEHNQKDYLMDMARNIQSSL